MGVPSVFHHQPYIDLFKVEVFENQQNDEGGNHGRGNSRQQGEDGARQTRSLLAPPSGCPCGRGTSRPVPPRSAICISSPRCAEPRLPEEPQVNYGCGRQGGPRPARKLAQAPGERPGSPSCNRGLRIPSDAPATVAAAVGRLPPSGGGQARHHAQTSVARPSASAAAHQPKESRQAVRQAAQRKGIDVLYPWRNSSLAEGPTRWSARCWCRSDCEHREWLAWAAPTDAELSTSTRPGKHLELACVCC